MIRFLGYWLPAVAAVGIGAVIVHGPVVDAYHDWTRDWHLWQLQAWGLTTLVFLAFLGGAFYFVVAQLEHARSAIARHQAQSEEEQV
jgi:hypothetical protein